MHVTSKWFNSTQTVHIVFLWYWYHLDVTEIANFCIKSFENWETNTFRCRNEEQIQVIRND